MSECPICIDTYNKSTKTKVCCNNPSCNFNACKTCVRTYLMNSTADLHCMNCRKSWEQAFVIINLNRSWFVNTYTAHHNNLLFERNKVLIQETMPEVDTYMERKRLRVKNSPKIKEIREQINNKITEIQTILISQRKREDEARKFYLETLRTLRQENDINRVDIHTEIYELRERKTELENECGIEAADKKRFIMPCQKEDCKGFLSTQYKCGVCETQCCSKCLDVLADETKGEHVCDENQVKSATHIKATTKPCPKCGERIYKTEGCNQMWCISCHCAFDWITGRIENGTVHNPHYFQFLRENNTGVVPRQPGDDPCGNYSILLNSCVNYIGRYLFREENDNKRNLFDYNTHYHLYAESLCNLTRVISHFENVEMTNARALLIQCENVIPERVRWIVKDMTEDNFRIFINDKNKRRLKYTDLLYIYELIVNVGKDIIQGLLMKITDNNINIEHITLRDKIKHTPIEVYLPLFKEAYDEIDNFISYCNDQFKIISMSHNCSVHCILSDRTTTRRRYTSSGNFQTHPCCHYRIRSQKSNIKVVKHMMLSNKTANDTSNETANKTANEKTG
jgi:hypothetical protein